MGGFNPAGAPNTVYYPLGLVTTPQNTFRTTASTNLSSGVEQHCRTTSSWGIFGWRNVCWRAGWVLQTSNLWVPDWSFELGKKEDHCPSPQPLQPMMSIACIMHLHPSWSWMWATNASLNDIYPTGRWRTIAREQHMSCPPLIQCRHCAGSIWLISIMAQEKRRDS